MRGPWDRQDHEKPFAVTFPKPVGAGFYPEDLDEARWKEYVAEHPEEKERLANLVTMVERREGGLVASNYSKVATPSNSLHTCSPGVPGPPRPRPPPPPPGSSPDG